MSFGELSNIFFYIFLVEIQAYNLIYAFSNATRTKCGIIPAWIIPHELFKNEYSAAVQYQVTMDDLFYDFLR